MPRIGIVTGLQSERALLSDLENTTAHCLGPGRTKARDAAAQAILDGAEALISFGICGALSRRLSTGEVLCPAAVSMEGGSDLAVDGNWRAAIPEPLISPIKSLLTSQHPVMNAADKSALSGKADAVDMESYGVAEAAHSAGLPFIALRAVSDDADQSVPKSALAGMRSNGANSAARTILRLLTRPQDIGPIIKTGRDYKIAMDALRGVAGAAGPGFWIGV